MFPGIDDMQKVDLRTVSHDIPPQEVSYWSMRTFKSIFKIFCYQFYSNC